MHYNFFADKQDKINILEYIFNETDLRVYDHSSALGEQVVEYKNAREIADKFDLETGSKFAVTFQLWSPRHKGQPNFNEVKLDPKRCKGFTFRYETQGLGLIQLYFGGILRNELNESHIGHFNEKGAAALPTDDDDITKWDWEEIQKTSRKLKYEIHNKRAVRKISSVGVLPGADELERQGLKLR